MYTIAGAVDPGPRGARRHHRHLQQPLLRDPQHRAAAGRRAGRAGRRRSAALLDLSRPDLDFVALAAGHGRARHRGRHRRGARRRASARARRARPAPHRGGRAASSRESGPLVARQQRLAGLPVHPALRSTATYALRWERQVEAEGADTNAERVRMMGISTIDNLDRVGHTCLVPDSEDHLWEARRLGRGLAAGERVIYFEDDTAGVLLGRLSDDRVPVAGAIEDGGLVIVPGAAHPAGLRLPGGDIVELMRRQIGSPTAEDGRASGSRASPANYCRSAGCEARRVRNGCRPPPGQHPNAGCSAGSTDASSMTRPSPACARFTPPSW